MDYGDGDHLNGRLELHAAVWQHGSKSVCELILLSSRQNGRTTMPL